MKMAWFGVEEWLNPMDSKAKINLGSSCVSALRLNELFDIIGQDENEFLKEFATMSLHYHHGDATGSPRVKAGVVHMYPHADFTADDVMMVHGGSAANELVEMALMEKGDNCVVIKPSYQQHYDIPKSVEMETRIVQLDEDSGYKLDMAALDAACDSNTKMIVFTNPNNPIGNVFTDEELGQIVEIATKYDAYILSDEMYRGMIKDDQASIMDYGYDKAIAVASTSKMFSSAGLRIGWIICKDKEMYEVMKTRRSYNSICCGIIDEVIASLEFENYEKIWARMRSILVPNKKIVQEWAAKEPHLKLIGDPWGTTCVIKYDYDVDSETLARDAMEDERKILFVPGDYFDMPGCIRVGYGAFRDPEVLKAGLAQFSDYLKKWEK